MSRIRAAFNKASSNGDGAFVPYVCAGDPDAQFTIEQIIRLSSAGADVIELGLPFSDPIADGPVIQSAMNRALSGGFTTGDLFEILRLVRSRGVSQPIVIMTYFNPILRYGPERFLKSAAEAGADGVLIVDLPPEESGSVDGLATSNRLDLIRLVAPSTSDQRLDEILPRASGFVYAVSVAGTTGARAEISRSAADLIKRTTAKTKLPVALGFGISRPEHVRSALLMGAAGVVEGSGLISSYSALLHQKDRALESVERHAHLMKQATLRAATSAQP